MAKKKQTEAAASPPVPEDRIIDADYSDIMRKNYIDYSMSVITARALPDVRDGLKPVQRRILYDCRELGVRSDKAHRKSARIVGDTMGKYHPHGDSSIYDALVVMAQDFKKGETLIDGHGNFGSIEGDGSAAMRYTESRLTPFAEDVLLDSLDHGTVDFVPNFDGTEKEPSVLPAKLPNILINGTEGIAVGMAAYVPPHNTGEVIDALTAYMKDPDITTEQLLELIPGPDFPTGGEITNKSELMQLYETGNGRIKIRGKTEIETGKNGAQAIVVTEIPFTMVGTGISKFLTDVESLAMSDLGEIADVSNQSSKDGMRIVIDLKKNADPERVLRVLYRKTKLEDSLGVNMLTIRDGIPEVMGLKGILEAFTAFRIETASREYIYLREREKDRLEVEEGLLRATDVIDLVIEAIRGSRSRQQAFKCLTQGVTDNIAFKSRRSAGAAAYFDFSEKQANAILDMRLVSLTGLEVDTLIKSIEKRKKLVERYTNLLESPAAMKKALINELAELKKSFGRTRKTLIGDISPDDAPVPRSEDREFMVIMDGNGYIRTMTVSGYKKSGSSEPACRTHSDGFIVILTQNGTLYTVSGADLMKIKSPVPADAVSGFNSEKDRVILLAGDGELRETTYVLYSREGLAKRIRGTEFIAAKKAIAGTKLKDGDILVFASPVRTYTEVVSTGGYVLAFPTSEIAEQKRASYGVALMDLKADEKVKSVRVTDDYERKRLSHRGRRGSRSSDNSGNPPPSSRK